MAETERINVKLVTLILVFFVDVSWAGNPVPADAKAIVERAKNGVSAGVAVGADSTRQTIKSVGKTVGKSISEKSIESMTLEDVKMRKRFGVGISAAGPLSVLGVEVDFNVSENVSLAGGIGTGLDYSTLMGKIKYHLLGDHVSPYFAAGFARWWTDGTREREVSPSVLRNKFLDGQDLTKGFSVWLVYPAIGVQFIHTTGFSLFAEFQYLFKLFNLANGTYAGLGAYWYF